VEAVFAAETAGIEPGSGVPSVGRAWAILGAYLGCQLVVQTILGAIIGARIAAESGGAADAEAFATALQSLAGPGACVAGAVAGLAVLRMAWLSPRRVSVVPAWLAPAATHELVAAGLAGIALGLTYLFSAGWAFPMEATVARGPLSSMATAPASRQWLWAAFAVLCAPAIEEIMFRGVLLTSLQRAWGTLCAAAVVTAIFVMLHAGEAATYPPALVAIGAIGILTLGLRLRTGRIGPAVSAHAGYNLVIVIHAMTL
jgi:membrane protease YdiL (CAAX protease family)